MQATSHHFARYVGSSVYRFSLTVHALFAVAICGLVAGCGTTGGTSRFVLPIEQSRTSPPRNRVDFGSFTSAAEGNIVISAGTYHWGAFTNKDEQNFKRSLIDTLNTVGWSSVEDENSAWRVHVILRRHIVAHDNNSGSVLAVISWSLSSGAGNIVYQEQFYATSSAFLVGTLGGMKDTVNKAIVQRNQPATCFLKKLAWSCRKHLQLNGGSLSQTAEVFPILAGNLDGRWSNSYSYWQHGD